MLDGTPDQYTSATVFEIYAEIAGRLGIPASAVSATVSGGSGSVVLTVVISGSGLNGAALASTFAASPITSLGGKAVLGMEGGFNILGMVAETFAATPVHLSPPLPASTAAATLPVGATTSARTASASTTTRSAALSRQTTVVAADAKLQGKVAALEAEVAHMRAAATSSLTAAPLLMRSVSPTFAPSLSPTAAPTLAPSVAPTAVPTLAPSLPPTALPTGFPSEAPVIYRAYAAQKLGARIAKPIFTFDTILLVIIVIDAALLWLLWSSVRSTFTPSRKLESSPSLWGQLFGPSDSLASDAEAISMLELRSVLLSVMILLVFFGVFVLLPINFSGGVTPQLLGSWRLSLFDVRLQYPAGTAGLLEMGGVSSSIAASSSQLLLQPDQLPYAVSLAARGTYSANSEAAMHALPAALKTSLAASSSPPQTASADATTAHAGATTAQAGATTTHAGATDATALEFPVTSHGGFLAQAFVACAFAVSVLLAMVWYRETVQRRLTEGFGAHDLEASQKTHDVACRRVGLLPRFIVDLTLIAVFGCALSIAISWLLAEGWQRAVTDATAGSDGYDWITSFATTMFASLLLSVAISVGVPIVILSRLRAFYGEGPAEDGALGVVFLASAVLTLLMIVVLPFVVIWRNDHTAVVVPMLEQTTTALYEFLGASAAEATPEPALLLFAKVAFSGQLPMALAVLAHATLLAPVYRALVVKSIGDLPEQRLMRDCYYTVLLSQVPLSFVRSWSPRAIERPKPRVVSCRWCCSSCGRGSVAPSRLYSPSSLRATWWPSGTRTRSTSSTSRRPPWHRRRCCAHSSLMWLLRCRWRRSFP